MKLAQPQSSHTSRYEDLTKFSCSKPDRKIKSIEKIQRGSVNISFGNVSFHANLFSYFQQKFPLNCFDRDFEGCTKMKFFIRFALKNVKIRYRIKAGFSSGWVCFWQGGTTDDPQSLFQPEFFHVSMQIILKRFQIFCQEEPFSSTVNLSSKRTLHLRNATELRGLCNFICSWLPDSNSASLGITQTSAQAN